MSDQFGRRLMERLFVTLGLVGLASCHDTEISVTPSGRATFRIEPAAPMLRPGASVQLTAVDLASGTPTTVRWAIDDTAFGTISPAGLLTAPVCPGAHSTVVTGVAVADQTNRATTSATRFGDSPPILAIASVIRSSDGMPAQLDSLSGQVSVELTITGCVTVSEWHLTLQQGGTGRTVASEQFSPPMLMTHGALTWNTPQSDNGAYALSAVASGPMAQLASNSVQVGIHNP